MKKKTLPGCLRHTRLGSPIVIIAAPPAVAASLGGVICVLEVLVVASLVVVTRVMVVMRAIVWAVHIV
jgi:hypothetical protein